MTVFTGFSIIKSPKRPMNPVFSKLPKSYAADPVWSRFFFHKKMKISAVGAFWRSWNNEMGVNARL
jgi:hypothetical protein